MSVKVILRYEFKLIVDETEDTEEAVKKAKEAFENLSSEDRSRNLVEVRTRKVLIGTEKF